VCFRNLPVKKPDLCDPKEEEEERSTGMIGEGRAAYGTGLSLTVDSPINYYEHSPQQIASLFTFPPVILPQIHAHFTAKRTMKITPVTSGGGLTANVQLAVLR